MTKSCFNSLLHHDNNGDGIRSLVLWVDGWGMLFCRQFVVGTCGIKEEDFHTTKKSLTRCKSG
jgi:hypothetical protein